MLNHCYRLIIILVLASNSLLFALEDPLPDFEEESVSVLNDQLNKDLHNLPVQRSSMDMGTHKIENVVDPTLDQEAATKKYVDDQVAVAGKSLGAWVSRTNNTSYLAATDGFVQAWGTGTVTVYTDGSDPPTTGRGEDSGGSANSYVMSAVKSGDYWKAVGANGGLFWIPLE